MSGNKLVRSMRDEEALQSRPSRFSLDSLISIAAVIAVGCLAFVGFSFWLAPRAPQPLAAPPAVVQATAELAWTEKDTERCKALARSAAVADVPVEAALADRTIAEGFASMATLLECQITTKVARFCDPEGKAALVAMVHDYYGKIDLLKVGLGIQGAPMAVLGEVVGGEVAMGSAVYDMYRDATFAAMTPYHKRVIAGLQSLGRKGIVAAPDFASFMGMGVPTHITQIFKDVSADQQLCA